ncbi:hypothetical protein QBC47DRAFT_1647 [Echria macrotheca]|uniref:C2H2-type domain-containing protein n=1 Tax=Echria macrotheca TaxID=438768 RepID=A0AAJ0BLH5_9PEZI|nr:hypothetical protein QBC47DRAFT_1647 [Echria macrotheca]
MTVSPNSSTEFDLNLGKSVQTRDEPLAGFPSGSGLHRMPTHLKEAPSGSESEVSDSDDDGQYEDDPDEESSITEGVNTLSMHDSVSEGEALAFNQVPGSNQRAGNTATQKMPAGQVSGKVAGKKRSASQGGGSSLGSKKPKPDDDGDDDNGANSGGGGGGGDGSGDQSRGETSGDARLACPYRKRNPGRFNVRTMKRCTEPFRDFSAVKEHIGKWHVRQPNDDSTDPENGIAEDRVMILRSRKAGSIRSWPPLWNALFPMDEKIQDEHYRPTLVVEDFEIEHRLAIVFPAPGPNGVRWEHRILQDAGLTPQSQQGRRFVECLEEMEGTIRAHVRELLALAASEAPTPATAPRPSRNNSATTQPAARPASHQQPRTLAPAVPSTQAPVYPPQSHGIPFGTTTAAGPIPVTPSMIPPPGYMPQYLNPLPYSQASNQGPLHAQAALDGLPGPSQPGHYMGFEDNDPTTQYYPDQHRG